LKEGTRGNSVAKSFLRSTLVVAQIAFALVALVGALLFVRTFWNLGAFNVGFDTRPLMTMRFYMPGAIYDEPDAKLRRVEDIVRRVEACLPSERRSPELRAAQWRGGKRDRHRRGARVGRAERHLADAATRISPTLGVRSEGRDFTDSEGWSHSPVAIINRQMKSQFWPAGDVIGRRFKLDGPKDDWFTIIGVTPDINLYGVDPGNDQAPATAYVPFAYQQFLNTGLTIRVDGDPASVTSAVREAIRASDPNLPMAQVRTMSELRRLQFWQYGLYGWIFGTTGIIGLLLAQLVRRSVAPVSQRAQEIGVRLALGVVGSDPPAGRRQGSLAAIGIVTADSAAAAMPAARTLLYKASPFDPLTPRAARARRRRLHREFLPARRRRGRPVIARGKAPPSLCCATCSSVPAPDRHGNGALPTHLSMRIGYLPGFCGCDMAA
jgi:hypothetical protein